MSITIAQRTTSTGKTASKTSGIHWLEPECLIANPLSLSIYGDPSVELDDMKASIGAQGILVPLVVAAGAKRGTWDIVSGHRRWACAMALGFDQIPCEILAIPSEAVRRRLVLEYNRQRHKSFSQLMREADVLEQFLLEEARKRPAGKFE